MDTGGGGDTIWVLSGAPVLGGLGGIVRAGAPSFTPFPHVWGQFAQNGVFSAQTEARTRGCCPHPPLSTEGVPNVFAGVGFGVLRAANLGGITELGVGGNPQNPKSAAPTALGDLGEEKNERNPPRPPTPSLGLPKSCPPAQLLSRDRKGRGGRRNKS